MSYLAGGPASAAAATRHPLPLVPASAAARAGRAALHDRAPCQATAAVRGGQEKCAACAGGDCSLMEQLQCALGGLQVKTCLCFHSPQVLKNICYYADMHYDDHELAPFTC